MSVDQRRLLELGHDPLTGEVAEAPTSPLEREQLRVEQLELDLRLAEEEIRKLRRTEALLRGRLQKHLHEAPENQKVTAIGRYYSHRLNKNGNWRLGEKRQKVVLARLREERDPLYICRAIDGLAIGHYTNPETGVKYDDLELVCRDEVKLEKYHQLAEANDAPTLISPSWERFLRGEEPDFVQD